MREYVPQIDFAGIRSMSSIRKTKKAMKKIKEIEEVIKNTNEETEAKINWTNAWSKKYPVLATYPKIVNISKYSEKIRQMLDSLTYEYGYNELDSMLVLKDILYHEWKDKK